MVDIKEKLSTLPDKPGVYLHKDSNGEVIYVGKAASLKNRVRQYFRSKSGVEPKTAALMSNIHDFEYIVTGNEIEALILENNLIKEYMPRYNVLLRDDKTYPYIKITMGEEFPRILKTRILKNDGSKYFGPYTDVKSVNTIINLLNDVFKLKRCATSVFTEGHRPCLNGHIQKCRKICMGNIDRNEYMKDIEAVISFLKGKDTAVIKYLKDSMKKASDLYDFEEAAKFRDYIASAYSIIKKQRVQLLSSGNIDIVLAADVVSSPKNTDITVFFVRNGRLSGREVHKATKPENTPPSDIIAAFIKQYYSSRSMIPGELILEDHILDEGAVSEYLSELKGKKVKISVPVRGSKKDLLKLAQKDIEESVRVQKIKKLKEEKMSREINAEWSKLLDPGLMKKDLRLEAYDISHIGGSDSVGAMVVFKGRDPQKKSYRKFRIQSSDGADDYGNMQEVVYRRLKRGLDNDAGFLPFPDIILIDGGKGHVNSVVQVLDGLKVDIPVAGMVKDDKHRTKGLILDEKELDLNDFPGVKKLIGSIQEEVHRFVIEYHRGLRNSNSLKSVLEDIPGIGTKRREELLREFGSVDKIKSATVEELAAVESMNLSVAQKVREFFGDV